MYQFELNKDLFSKPISLSKAEIKDPNIVFYAFFDCYHLYKARQILWDWLETALTSENYSFENAMDRNRLIWFSQHVEKMMEAAHLMNQKNKRKSNKIIK